MANKITAKAALKELAKRRKREQERATAPKLELKDFCFPKQLQFILDKAKFKTGVCSRRAGKSVGCAADLVHSIINNEGVTCLYITLSRRNAKKIIWRELMKILKQFKLYDDCDIDRQELSIEYRPTSSMIYVSGAKDAEEIEKFRGLALFKVYIDESQSFREYIRELIDDVIEPALFDYDGSLILIGTPGPICAGYYYEACHNDEWSHHHWTLHDNPHIQAKSGKTVDQLLSEQRRRRGISEADPSYQRESLGRWVQDTDSLVFKYNAIVNNFHEMPERTYYYVVGVDIGYDDADAIAVLAYSDHDPEVYLVEEYTKREESISELVSQIKYFRDKYQPTKIVMDAGALGKKIQEEILQRHSLHIEAAQKERKLEFIELLNDDLRSGRFKLKPDSICAQDYHLIQWDMDKSTNGKRIVSDRFHSDIADAVLYAWRECRHYTWEAKISAPKVGSQAYMDAMEKEEAEAFDEKKRREQSGFETLYDINENAWWEE